MSAVPDVFLFNYFNFIFSNLIVVSDPKWIGSSKYVTEEFVYLSATYHDKSYNVHW